MIIPNGQHIYSDPLNHDSDNDGLTDGEEMGELRSLNNAEFLLGISNAIPGFAINGELTVHYICFDYKSHPNFKDSDGDGLLDGNGIYKDEKKIAPKDPDPLISNGPKNAWKTHIAQIESGENLAFDYSNDYNESVEVEAEFEFLWGWLPYLNNNFVEVFLSTAPEIGSIILDFRYDDKHIALHSDTSQWQSLGGYNDLYDWVFNKATSMNKLKLNFNSDDQDYVVWAWKGNYMNLGPGSEVGFYTKSNAIDSYTGLEHWIVDKEFPMTLSLYKIVGNGLYTNYYNWLPDMEQWWITGFAPDIYNVGDYLITEDELLQIASVDFSKKPEMFNDLKTTWEHDTKAEFLIFDEEDNTLWIIW